MRLIKHSKENIVFRLCRSLSILVFSFLPVYSIASDDCVSLWGAENPLIDVKTSTLGPSATYTVLFGLNHRMAQTTYTWDVPVEFTLTTRLEYLPLSLETARVDGQVWTLAQPLILEPSTEKEMIFADWGMNWRQAKHMALYTSVNGELRLGHLWVIVSPDGKHMKVRFSELVRKAAYPGIVHHFDASVTIPIVELKIDEPITDLASFERQRTGLSLQVTSIQGHPYSVTKEDNRGFFQLVNYGDDSLDPLVIYRGSIEHKSGKIFVSLTPNRK